MAYTEEFKKEKLFIPKFAIPPKSASSTIANSSSLEKRDPILNRFVERRENLQAACKAEGLLGLDQYLVEEVARPWPNMLYVDEHKLLYCSVPKEGVRKLI